MGKIPLPLAIVREWKDANNEDSPTAWAFMVGFISATLAFRADIGVELSFLACVASHRQVMASKGGAA
jgi:hypothetical protein